jgi:rare lipoprotein A
MKFITRFFFCGIVFISIILFYGCSPSVRFTDKKEKSKVVSEPKVVEQKVKEPKVVIQDKTPQNKKESPENIYFTGIASYYADKFDGRKTANGEIFNQKLLTAAHKTLPFGTIVRVTNLRNNKQVVVRINDRGPFIEGRVIDLSLAAAREIDMVRDGIVKVKVEIIK